MHRGEFLAKSTLKVRYSKKIAPNPLIKGELIEICSRIHKTGATSLIFAIRSINQWLIVNVIPSIPKNEGESIVFFLHYRKSGAST